MSSWIQDVAVNSGAGKSVAEATTDGGAACSHLTGTLLTERPDISPFEPEWERLFAFPGNEPSTSFEWTQALLRHRLAEGDRFLLVGISRGSETVALVPLVVRSARILGCRIRALCPISDIRNTHSGVLARSLGAAVADTLVATLFELPVPWDVFRMSNLLEDSPLLGHLASAARSQRVSSLLRDAYASYFLELPASYEHYLAGRSSKFRNHLRRVERKISSETGVVVSEFSGVDEVARGYEMLLEVERASWKHVQGTAISTTPRGVAFYRDLCLGAAARGRLHLQVLTLGGRPAAYNLGYVHDSTYYYLKTSFDEALKPLGVATYLRARLIRSLIDRGLRAMDFPAAPHEWERQWTETARWHRKLTMYRGTAPGVGLAVVQRLRHRTPRQRSIQHLETRNRRPR